MAILENNETDFVIPEPHLRQQFLPIGKNAGKEDTVSGIERRRVKGKIVFDNHMNLLYCDTIAYRV